ncbi:MAG TPA: hypothetical protein VFC41_01045 [Anaerovoracaceae bacterium]|nr:hypothetical protein [Anaerovoracaceae bacterium]
MSNKAEEALWHAACKILIKILTAQFANATALHISHNSSTGLDSNMNNNPSAAPVINMNPSNNMNHANLRDISVARRPVVAKNSISNTSNSNPIRLKNKRRTKKQLELAREFAALKESNLGEGKEFKAAKKSSYQPRAPKLNEMDKRVFVKLLMEIPPSGKERFQMISTRFCETQITQRDGESLKRHYYDVVTRANEKKITLNEILYEKKKAGKFHKSGSKADDDEDIKKAKEKFKLNWYEEAILTIEKHTCELAKGQDLTDLPLDNFVEDEIQSEITEFSQVSHSSSSYFTRPNPGEDDAAVSALNRNSDTNQNNNAITTTSSTTTTVMRSVQPNAVPAPTILVSPYAIRRPSDYDALNFIPNSSGNADIDALPGSKSSILSLPGSKSSILSLALSKSPISRNFCQIKSPIPIDPHRLKALLGAKYPLLPPIPINGRNANPATNLSKQVAQAVASVSRHRKRGHADAIGAQGDLGLSKPIRPRVADKLIEYCDSVMKSNQQQNNSASNSQSLDFQQKWLEFQQKRLDEEIEQRKARQAEVDIQQKRFEAAEERRREEHKELMVALFAKK